MGFSLIAGIVFLEQGCLFHVKHRNHRHIRFYVFFNSPMFFFYFGYVGDSVVVVRETTGGVFKGFVYRVGDFIKPYTLQICFLDSSMRFYCFT